MRRPKQAARSTNRRATAFAGIILVQVSCALFFISDVIRDLRLGDNLTDPHIFMETLAAIAMIGGVLFLMVELRRLLTRMDDMDVGLRAARGEMEQVMGGFFEDWNLTAAERDVALMILKGLDNDTIAQVRGTASGTVRAQATSVYAKSGTLGRAQFVSLFMEELMSGDFGRVDTPNQEGALTPPASPV